MAGKFRSFEDITNEYEYIRHKNLRKYSEKKNDIYAKHPALQEYDEKIVDLYLEITKATYANIDTKKLYDELSSIKKQRSDYIKEHKINDDYREVEYTCEKCKDTGFVDGKKCSCFMQKEIELFDTISNFKEYIKTDNFDNLNKDYYKQDKKVNDTLSYSEYMDKVLLHINDALSNIESKPYNALFIGATGTGKTFLARCIGTEFLRRNKSVLYLNVNEYLNSLKPDYEGRPLKTYAVACDLLIIDDLGTEYSTEFTKAELNYIIDKRINDNKSTIITTNLLNNQIKERYLDSMFSRITHIYTKYMLLGEDIRGIKYAGV